MNAFRQNHHSQSGEDGVLAEIIRRIGLEVGEKFWCVEFGAWDGKYMSNTFSLVQNFGARAVYIEGDIEKFKDLMETSTEYPSIIPVLSFVISSHYQEDSLTTPAFTGAYERDSFASLDQILNDQGLPKDYDLLSIDIDSRDLEIWQSHEDFHPKIVVIEVNSSIPPGVLQWHGHGRGGNSFSSTISVAREKGYTLACHTGNMIFVRNDFVELVGIGDLDQRFPERLFDYSYISEKSSWFSKVINLASVKVRKALKL